MKREPIRETVISAHGLVFRVITEPVCNEEDFAIFCDDLQYAITNHCDAGKAAELHQGNDGCFFIDYEDGTFHDVDYDACAGTLLIKQAVYFNPPGELNGAGCARRDATEDSAALDGKKRTTGRRFCRMQ